MKKLIVSIFMCCGLVACGGGDSKTEEKQQNNTSSSPSTQVTTTEEFKSKLPDNAPVIKVATAGELLPPFVFQGQNGQLQGIDIDVIRAIGEDQGFKVDITKEPFGELFTRLEKGQYQVVIYDLALTKERAEKFAHTIPYFHNPSVIMYNAENTINSLNDLKNLRIATFENSRQSLFFDKIETKQHDKLNTVFAQFQGLVQNKYDAIVQDKYLVEYLALSYPEHKVKIMEYEPETEMTAKLVMYTKKNDQELINKLNKGIESLQKSGEIDRITKKYLKVN